MTSAVTAPMHAGGWNVILTIANQQYLGGFYQNPREPTVTFGDLCAELALCFDYPGGGNLLNNVDNVDNVNSVNSVNSFNTANTVNAASLVDNANSDRNQDHDNINERPWFDIAFALAEMPDEANFPLNHPSFVTSERFDELVPGLASESAARRRTVTYHIVHHNPCNISGSFKDHMRAKCVYSLPDPHRRHHPAFLPYNKSPADPCLNVMPLRRKAKARSQSPPKRSGSSSPNKPDDAAGGPDNQGYDTIAPAHMDMDIDAVRKTISDFRMASMAQTSCCAISGGGRPWSALQIIGPGVQASHIVPQQHYHLYPLGDPSDTTQDSARRQCQAWGGDGGPQQQHSAHGAYQTWHRPTRREIMRKDIICQILAVFDAARRQRGHSSQRSLPLYTLSVLTNRLTTGYHCAHGDNSRLRATWEAKNESGMAITVAPCSTATIVRDTCSAHERAPNSRWHPLPEPQ